MMRSAGSPWKSLSWPAATATIGVRSAISVMLVCAVCAVVRTAAVVRAWWNTQRRVTTENLPARVVFGSEARFEQTRVAGHKHIGAVFVGGQPHVEHEEGVVLTEDPALAQFLLLHAY